MGDVGLLKQGWSWLWSSPKRGFASAATARASEVATFAERHWPTVCSGGVKLGKVLLASALLWRDCFISGCLSLSALGHAAVLVTAWGGYVSLTSTSYASCALLVLGAVGATIHCLGHTPGLLILGFFGILIMWINSILWLAGTLLVLAGYIISCTRARILILASMAYSVYCVYAHAGCLGIFLSFNLAFISNDILNKFLQGCDCMSEDMQFEKGKDPDPVTEVLPEDYNFFHQKADPVSEVLSEEFDFFNLASEAEKVASSCKVSNTPNYLAIQNEPACAKVIKSDSSSLDEIKRIMSSANHYEALGFIRNKEVDQALLRKEYHKKAMLVHPDKNLGNPLASESFKKLQCAYEVLSDSAKKKIYDEQLRKEESRSVCQNPCSPSQTEVEYQPEESRKVECSKCGNAHLWVCTTRSKAKARWCQACRMYHPAKDGDGWIECGTFGVNSPSQKVDIPRAFVCAESKIFDVSEWATCQFQGMACRANDHRPGFHVRLVELQRTTHARFHWDLIVQMTRCEDEDSEFWRKQGMASDTCSESSKSKKSWSPFKLSQKKSPKSSRRWSMN